MSRDFFVRVEETVFMVYRAKVTVHDDLTEEELNAIPWGTIAINCGFEGEDTCKGSIDGYSCEPYAGQDVQTSVTLTREELGLRGN